MTLVSDLKNLIAPAERKPLRILTGPFKGIVMSLSLQNQSQLYLGLFERETYPWLVRLSRGVSTAIDIGAGHGEYTIYFIQKTNAAKVFAFEPDPQCITLLQENLGISGSNGSGRLELSTKFVTSCDTDQEIQMDSLLRITQVPCLIKMDVDGAEEQVLAGASGFNSRPAIRWLIETHSKDLELACDRILKTAGFQTKIIARAWWRVFIPELRPTKHNRWLAAWKSEDLSL